MIASIAASNGAAKDPKGPEMRWSSSWIINEGGIELSLGPQKNTLALSSHGNIANLSIVPRMIEGGSEYNASSTIFRGINSENSHSIFGQRK
jgi:hypothetical protein